jgi:putative two-component system response regulator
MGPAEPAASLVTKELQALGSRLEVLGREELRETLRPLVEGLQEPLDGGQARPAIENALALCRALYARALSGEAVPLAKAALAQATCAGDPMLMRRAATACGALSADTADLVGAVEHHVIALRLATAAGDKAEASGFWNNIGLAMGIGGHYELAARCYRRCIELVDADPRPLYGRYAGATNLADSLFQVGGMEEGLAWAQRALREQTQEFRDRDLLSALFLRRNFVRLLVALGRFTDAEPHVRHCSALAEQLRTPRASIAAATARATYELAAGYTDLALTRLEQAVARAREVPPALRDTLACLVRAEEAAGNVERALVRLGELSDHIYRVAIDRARQHVELGNLLERVRPGLDHENEQSKARLVSQVSPRTAPESWSALERLSVSASLRMEPTGRHGKRVGALVKALALANGCDPFEALEIGLAAQLHDIGMMSVPEAILARRGTLNPTERSIVRRHVDAGAEMLADDRHPRIFLAREIARYHHARWDGEGYPERVAGNRIPLAARLCAVADAYDAMVCGLGWREPRTMDGALAELRAQAGRQFDPRLVERFDALIRTETEDLGMDLATENGMEGFHALVDALQEDRGFV